MRARNRYFYEYVIAQTINEFNAGASPDDVIRVSEGRLLRNQIVQELGNKPWNEVRGSEFIEAANKVLSGRMGVEEGFGNETTFARYRDKYMALSGWGRGVDEVKGSNFWIPISPYDPAFTYRSTVMHNGSSILYANADDIEALESPTQEPGEAPTSFLDRTIRARGLDDVRFNHKVTLWSNVESERGNPREVGPCATRADLIGLSKLAPYMDQNDFTRMVNTPELYQWIGNPEVLSDAEIGVVQNGADRAAAVCKYLKDTGREVHYDIDWSQSTPYVKARVDGTRIQVRLTAPPQQAQSIGRVYDSGVSYSFITSYQSQSSSEMTGKVDLTEAEGLIPIRMALGEDIRTYDADTVAIRNRGKLEQHNVTYVNSKSMRTALRSLPNDPYNQQLEIRMDISGRSARSQNFDTPESAESYLRDAVGSARGEVLRQLDVEDIIAAVKAMALDEFENAPDEEIMLQQEAVIAYLTEATGYLMRPGQDSAEFMSLAMEADASLLTGEVSDGSIAEALLQNRLAEISYPQAQDFEGRIANVRQFAEDYADAKIGTFEPDPVTGERFDADAVSLNMLGAYGIFRNRDDLVAACVKLGIQPSELKCGGELSRILADRLVQFDAETARPMTEAGAAEPFLGRMSEVIRQSLDANAVTVTDMQIDDSGIVQWKGIRRNNTLAGKGGIEVTGTIGQIFAPDEKGAITTAFASGDDYVLVPGYDAYIMGQAPGERKSVEERTRLIGYEQAMERAIRYQIRQDLAVGTDVKNTGMSTTLNRVYRHVPGERYDLDWWRESRQGGMTDELADAIMSTQAGRVRYANSIRDGSTINAVSRAAKFGIQVDNDNFGDAFTLTGGRNMAILGKERDGYFDPMMTTSDTNQGTTVYLVEGAQVQPDGSIVPGPAGDRAPLAKLPELETMAFDPFNRQQMTYSNIMHSVRMTEANVAQMTFGGWNMEDAVVVSKEFAAANEVMGSDGKMRPLIAGDKLSDLHGNKGVVSLVVDREMSDAEAERLGITDQVAWYRANPDLDIVMAPFSAVSRFNGGTAREMMPTAQDLVTPDGKVLPGCMGRAHMVVTDKTADAATHAYTDADISDGKGRKVSSQLIWALDAAGCENILSEVFSKTNSKAATVREALLCCGLDMDPYGNVRKGYEPHPGENRQVMQIAPLERNAKGNLKGHKMSIDFAKSLSDEGGILAMPFPMKALTGDEFPQQDGKWMVPVMSASMRSAQELADGESIIHDYTNEYRMMYRHAVQWLDADERLQTASEEERPKYEAAKAKFARAAQSACNNIAQDVVSKKINGKHNMFKDTLMSRRMRQSATSIITPNPNLPVDQIAIGRAMADVLDIPDTGGNLMVWRDPILREGGVRYMRVMVSDDICGVAINPVSFQCMDGDFDGDKVGLLRLNTPEAEAEAAEKLSFGVKMLEPSYQAEDGKLDLGFNTGLDVTCGMLAEGSRAKEILDSVRAYANDEDMSDPVARRMCLANVSEAVHEAMSAACGQHVISYASPEANLASIKEACIDTGAKGSPGKLADYAKYLGIELKSGAMDAEGNIDWSRAVDRGVSLATRQDHENTEAACAIKSFGTGVAGKYSQRGIKALRDVCPRAVLECTKPVTQAVLQAKHDPVAAMNTYELLQGPVRDLWRGGTVTYDSERGRWQTLRDGDGNLVPANMEAWINSFMTIYTDKHHGMNEKVNPDFVRELALAMKDDKGKMRSIDDLGSLEGGASFMDVMAYDGTFPDLVMGAEAGRNLWEGSSARLLMPDTIRKNQLAEESMKGLDSGQVQLLESMGMGMPVKAVVKQDTQVKKPREEAKCTVRPSAVDGSEDQFN